MYTYTHVEIQATPPFSSGTILIFIIFRPRGAGAFSRDFTTNLVQQCRPHSGALKIGKLKAPLFPGPKGAVDSNDWCIIRQQKIQSPGNKIEHIDTGLGN